MIERERERERVIGGGGGGAGIIPENEITRIEWFGHLCVVHVLPKLRHRERALCTRRFEFSRPPSFPRADSHRHTRAGRTYTRRHTPPRDPARVLSLSAPLVGSAPALLPAHSPAACIHTRAHAKPCNAYTRDKDRDYRHLPADKCSSNTD